MEQLFKEKWNITACVCEVSRVKEIQARHWVKEVWSGFMDYQYPLQAFQHGGIDNVRQKEKVTAREALGTGVQVLGKKCGYEVKYMLVVRK